MKAISAILAASLAANALVLAVVVFRPSAARSLMDGLFAPDREEAPSLSESRGAGGPPAGAAAGVPSEAKLGWSDLAADDWPAFTARLRAAGFPPGVVRTIVMARVDQHFGARRRELMSANPGDYWRNDNRFGGDRRNGAALQALHRAQAKLLRELLGPDYQRPVDDEQHRLNQRRQFGDLDPQKITQIQKITSDYEEMSSRLREESLGIMLPEDRAQLALLEREKRVDLERLLTPNELLEYDLRNSPSAQQLRNRLGRFEASEVEFRALYEIQKAFDEKYPGPGADGMMMPFDSARMRARQQAMRDLDRQFEETLGAARADDLKKARTAPGNLEQLERLMTRLNLPVSAATSAVAIQQDVQQRATALRTNSTLRAEQRTAEMARLASEASSKLTELLSPRGLEAYRQNGGQWLQNLAAQGAAAEATGAIEFRPTGP